MHSDLLFFSVISAQLFFVNGQSSCKNPDGQQGLCVSLYHCSSLITMMTKQNITDDDKQFLRASKCGYDGNTPKVCCSDVCTTPDKNPGVCVHINSCPDLVELLQSPVPEEYVQLVNNSRCASNVKYSVCCPTVPSPKQCAELELSPNSKCCGVDAASSTKVFGASGVNPPIDMYPWLALIEYSQGSELKLLCGGTLVSSRHVITAAHCVAGGVLDHGTPKNVRLGEYDISHEGPDCELVAGVEDCTEGTVTIPVEKISVHPDYKGAQHSSHDIAVIKLATKAPFTDFIRPICLPSSELTGDSPYEPLFIAGWGVSSNKQLLSPKLQHIHVPYAPINVCRLAYNSSGRNTLLSSGQVCAGGVPGTKDSCKRDSGGPLMGGRHHSRIGQYWELMGVASFGPMPCDENLPGVFTRVFEYMNWIKSVIFE